MDKKQIKKLFPKMIFLAVVAILCFTGYVMSTGGTTIIGPGNMTTTNLTATSITATTITATTINASTYDNLPAGSNVNGTAISVTQVNSTQYYMGSSNLTSFLQSASISSNNLSTASYIVYEAGSAYYAVNTTTGLVDYSGADAYAVIRSAELAIDTSPGGVVYLLPGSYSLSATLTIYFNITLEGADKDVTILTPTTNSTVIIMDRQAVFENLQISVPSSYTGTAIQMNGSSHFDFENAATINNVIFRKPLDTHSGGIAIQMISNQTSYALTASCVGMTLENIVTYGNWSIGLEMYTGPYSQNWNNGNQFYNLRFFGPTVDIAMLSNNATGAHNGGNIFTGVEVQKSSGTYVVIMDGQDNIFTGCMFWDLSSSQVPVYFNSTANDNYIQVASSRMYNIVFEGGTNNQNTVIDVDYGGEYSTGLLTTNIGSLSNTTATTFVFAHNLQAAPAFVDASFSTTAVSGWTWTANATYVTITVAGTSLPASITCYWSATYSLTS